MAPAVPITLVGDNLDERHKYLNSLVNESYKKGEDFDLIKDLPEKSPIDRLFKIDLASKLRNVDYIFQNLQDDDMLFVSRALKATWLIGEQYMDKINPKYLEDNTYPKMITTAVNKMQNWIHLHLNDEIRCRKFYDYYFEKNFNLAMKFLVKCSKDDIEREFNKVIYKVTPHYLKMLCEKTSKVGKIFFDSISSDDKIKSQYLNAAKAYFNTMRHFLKTDGDMVLDITEKYFDRNMDKHRFSREQTKIILKYHKERFWRKPELYTGWLLNTQALADSLDSEEAKALVLKLAQASYLSIWFTYQHLEPLIKRLNPNERAIFKKKVFVDKDIGDIVQEWPYNTPEPPVNNIEYVTIFDDIQPQPSEYEHLKPSNRIKRPIRKKKGNKNDIYQILESCSNEKTLLDKLFNEFRFVSFGKTLYELRKRISAESSPQNRQFMILVLISKSGGRLEAVASLLELLAQHVNETATFRAAIIRSLVKRAQVWRLQEKSWDQLLKFGHGLGLDGKTPEAECIEGLHAVVIHSLLSSGDCEPHIKNTFVFRHFSTFNDYSLSATDKSVISTVLPKMLLTLVNEKEFFDEIGFRTSSYCIDKLIETLETYKIKLETYPGLIETIAKFATKELSPVDHILDHLYRAKIARKQLFRYTFHLVRTDESHLNALRHDTSVLDPKHFAEIYGTFIIGVDRFFRKLSIYFSEENGLASKFLEELKAKDLKKVHGRLLAFLLKEQLVSYLDELDAQDGQNSKLLASVIRGNAHLARPALDLDVYGWSKIGAKYVECKLIKCRSVDIDINIEKLLKWKRTARTAVVLAKRTKYLTEVFVKLASLKPTTAIKSGLKIIISQAEKVETKIWETIKPIIQELDVTKSSRQHIVKQLGNIDKIPMKIKPEYATVIYTSFLKISLYHAMPPLCHVEILLPDTNEQFVENIVIQFLKNDFSIDKLNDDTKQIECTCMYIRIFTKFLLLSKSEEEQKRKIEAYCNPFLTVLDEIRNHSEKKDLLQKYLPEMLRTMKYSKVLLSEKFVSPLPVIENVIVWMKKYFIIVEQFSTFAQLHMLMLLYKATQQALKSAPEVFSDDNRRKTEGVEILGNIFGNYIATEVNNLQKVYFETIPELYTKTVISFLENFNQYSIISSDLLSSIIRGISGGDTLPACRLGIHLLNEKYYDIRDEQSTKLINFVHKIDCPESQWLFSIFER